MKGENIVKKKITLKAFLVLLVISLIITGLTGCTPETSLGKVYIALNGICTYDILMDSITKFSGVGTGYYTLNNVSIGNHTFEAIDTCEGSPHGSDSVTAYIQEGDNWVYLNPKSIK